MTGTCALCHKNATLRKSHYIPAALYRVLHEDDDINSNKLLQNFSGKKFSTADKQLVCPLLCSNCENLFSTNGEKEIAKSCLHKNSFPLREQLQTFPISSQQKEMVLFEPQHFDIEKGCWLYFALSVFWRGSVTPWGHIKTYYHALGEYYQEQIRQYLLTTDPTFLKNIIIILNVDLDSAPINFIEFPRHVKRGLDHFHVFYIPGIEIMMYIGHTAKELGFSKQNIIFAGHIFKKNRRYTSLVKYIKNFDIDSRISK